MDKLKTILELALGDGYISLKKSKNGNCTFRMHHGIKQKDYVLHKQQILKDVGIESVYREYIDKKGFHVCYVLTKRYPEITEARRILYIDRKKHITKELLEYLDEKSLCFLFQDDGSTELTTTKRKNHENFKYINNFVLNVQNFDFLSVQLLSNWLKETLIENKIYKRKNYLVITIAKLVSKINFVNLLVNHIHPSMQYKIVYPVNATANNF